MKLFLLFALILVAVTAQAAPTASISCPATAFVGEPVICNGSASTNVNGQIGWSVLTYVDGASPVAWDFGDALGAYSRAEILKATHVYLAAGTYTIGLTVKDAALASAFTSTSITISDIPAASGGGILPLTDQGSTGANCTALQTAITTAFGANTVEQEIRLPAITYTCALTIPAAFGSKYVTIRPTVITWLPTALKRLNGPVLTANMPKLRSPGVDQIALSMNGSGRKYLRLLGIEMTKQAGHIYNLIEIGNDSAPVAFGALPNHIIIDRCYLHGLTTDGADRAIFSQADYISIINSYFEDFHNTGSDTQTAISIGGVGFGFVNNYAEAYGENIMFGGADTAVRYSSTASSGSTTSCTLSSVTDLTVGTPISFVVGGVRGPDTATIVRSIAGSVITYDTISGTPDTTASAVKYGSTPADIFIARNYFFKDRFYRVGDALYNGSYAPVVKNSIEFKHGMRAILTGNYVDGNWGGQGQSGPTILFTVRNQSNNNPWAVVRDIQFTDNRLIHMPDVFNFLGVDDSGPPNSGPADRAQYITARNNLVEDLNKNAWNGSYGVLLLTSNGPRNITITHNTAINTSGSQCVIATGPATSNVLFVNNICSYRDYGFFGDGGTLGDTAIAQYMPDGFFRYNVLSDDISMKGPTGGSWTAPRGAPNYFPATIDTGTFVNRAAGDYHLAASSPYKAGGATPGADGADIGVNYDDVSTATINTIVGDWTGVTPPTVCRWSTSPVCQ